MIALAAFLSLCGLCSALLYLVMPLTARGSDVASNVVLGSLAGFGVFLGAALGWQGANILRQRGSRAAARAFPPVLLCVSAFLLAVLIGLGALALGPVAAYAFPPWHFLAATIPPLALLAFAARRLGGASGLRALITSFTWGALGATPLALLLEIVIGLLLVFLAALALALSPEGRMLLERWQAELPRLRDTLDYATAARLLTNPGIAIGVLAYISICVPLVEEALKTLVVAFVDPRRTKLADAILWGVSASAGFATIENLFNVEADSALWAVTALMRVGATTMHVANGVTMGRGWYAARVERRWSRLFIALAVSVFVHAAWNAAAIALSGIGLVALDATHSAEMLLPAGVLIVALALALGVLACGGWVWIAYSTYAARESAA
jgi:RsiW-degrading membrane proteinase PrsW (M82 family)